MSQVPSISRLCPDPLQYLVHYDRCIYPEDEVVFWGLRLVVFISPYLVLYTIAVVQQVHTNVCLMHEWMICIGYWVICHSGSQVVVSPCKRILWCVIQAMTFLLRYPIDQFSKWIQLQELFESFIVKEELRNWLTPLTCMLPVTYLFLSTYNTLNFLGLCYI